MEMTAEEIQLWEEAMARGMEKERNEEEELQISTSSQEKEDEKVSNTSTDEENDLVISADEDQEDPTPLNQKIHQLENELQKLAGVKAAKEDIENNYLALQDQFLELKREWAVISSPFLVHDEFSVTRRPSGLILRYAAVSVFCFLVFTYVSFFLCCF